MMMKERILNYWSGRAEEFSQLRMNDYESDLRDCYMNCLRQQIPKKDGTIRALDLGTGAGFFAILLSQLGCKVTAVDFSEEMIVQARKNAEDKGSKNIEFYVMDVQDMKFADHQFDVIVSRNVTWILPDAKKAYKEMVRVLAHGGILINMDANYGKVFKEAEDKGEKPVHPTQTEAQLKERNELAIALEVSRQERPLWDINVLMEAGMQQIYLHRNLDEMLGIKSLNQPYVSASKGTKAEMFFLSGIKP
jgi:SAM-dependent methyltransferase